MDYNILAAMTQRRYWERLADQIPQSMLSPDTTNMLNWIGLYFKTYAEHSAVMWPEFESMMTLRASALTPEQAAIMRVMYTNVQRVPSESVTGVISMLNDLAYSGAAAALCKQYQDGEEVDLCAGLKELHRKYGAYAGANDTLMRWEDRSMDELLSVMSETEGLKLRTFKQLEDTVRGLIGGDLICVAAPVDAGKTSLLAEIVVDFAEQMKDAPERYGERPILWLVNESIAARSVLRVRQAATHLTLQDIALLHSQDEFMPMYLKKVGSIDRIRIKDAHSINFAQIETLMEEMKPAVLIVDMVSHLKAAAKESETLSQEDKWSQLRILGCEHDCVVIGTCQLSEAGYDMLYPPLTALKQSRNGIQGTLDLALYMGCMDKSTRPDMRNVRGISTPKNKLALSGKESYAQFQVEFDGGICKFSDGG